MLVKSRLRISMISLLLPKAQTTRKSGQEPEVRLGYSRFQGSHAYDFSECPLDYSQQGAINCNFELVHSHSDLDPAGKIINRI